MSESGVTNYLTTEVTEVTEQRTGLLIDFHVARLKDGIKRRVN
jgi:hypothetical protein